MRTDRKGDMGFAEAMLAMMTVSVVLMMYIGSVATAVEVDVDPLDGLDTDRMDARIEGGAVVPGFEDYLREFISATGTDGIRATVTVPGGFVTEPLTVTVGEGRAYHCHRSFSQHIEDDCGRVLVAVYEVSLCI